MSRSRAITGPTAAALLAVALQSGCTGIAGFDGPDPLTGGPPIQKRTSPAPGLAAGLSSSPSGTLPPTTAGQLPPVPTPSTATSQAALAGGISQQTLEGNRDLRIGNPTAAPPEQPLWRGADTTASAGARLSEPQGIGATSLPPAPTPVTVVPGSVTPPPYSPPSAPSGGGMVLTGGGAQADTLDQALKQLSVGRNVTWQRLETLDKGGWSFQCSIANPAKPDVENRYMSSGTTDLEAVRKVLDQIALEKK